MIIISPFDSVDETLFYRGDCPMNVMMSKFYKMFITELGN